MQSYHYSIYKHVMPEFGPMRMMDILPEHVRAWIKRMKKNGVSAATIVSATGRPRGAAEPSPWSDPTRQAASPSVRTTLRARSTVRGQLLS